MKNPSENAPTAQDASHVNAPGSEQNRANAQPDTTTWPGMETFIEGLFGQWIGQGKGSVWTTALRDIEAAKNGGGAEWHGAPGTGDLRTRFPTMEADLYFSIGVMGPEETRRSNRGVIAQPLLIVDDIGTKIDRAKWDALFAAGCPRPTAEIETSPGNETWVWALAGDAAGAERWQDLALIRAYLVDAGLTDDVMDPARYIRLPGGRNSKPLYRPAGAGIEQSPAVRLKAWRLGSDGRVDVENLGEAIVGTPSGTSVMGRGQWRSAPKSASAQRLLTSAQIGTGAQDRTADLSKPEPIMRLAAELGMDPKQVRPGVVEALCPNIKAHTTRADTGFAFIGDGIMCCSHASCQGLATPDFREMMMEQYDMQQAGRAAMGLLAEGEARSAGEYLARASFEASGGLSDTAEAAAVAEAMAEQSRERAQEAQAQAITQTRAAIMGAPFAPVMAFAPRQIPPRAWLYGRVVIKGFLSMLVAPGGAGKSALALSEALAMATGRELLPGETPVRPLRVWMHNAEDDMDEMDRRLAGAMLHFDLSHTDLGGNLFMTSGRDMGLQLARMGRDGPEIAPGVVDALVERLTASKIDVLMLDPLGALHTLPENSNEAANLLSGALREVAHRAGVGLILLHHTSKGAAADMDAAGAGASRGASAFVDAARVVRQVVRMTDKEAARHGIAEADRRDYLRVENGKANLARAEGGRWLRMVDMPLGNGAGLWPHGDRVGVAERWTPPTAQPGTASDLARVQAALLTSPRAPRADHRSPEWIGWLVARVMGLDVGGPTLPKEDRTPDQNGALARVRNIVAGWIENGGLTVRTEPDPDTRKKHRFVFCGQAAVLMDADAGEGPADTDAEDDAE